MNAAAETAFLAMAKMAGIEITETNAFWEDDGLARVLHTATEPDGESGFGLSPEASVISLIRAAPAFFPIMASTLKAVSPLDFQRAKQAWEASQ